RYCRDLGSLCRNLVSRSSLNHPANDSAPVRHNAIGEALRREGQLHGTAIEAFAWLKGDLFGRCETRDRVSMHRYRTVVAHRAGINRTGKDRVETGFVARRYRLHS